MYLFYKKIKTFSFKMCSSAYIYNLLLNCFYFIKFFKLNCFYYYIVFCLCFLSEFNLLLFRQGHQCLWITDSIKSESSGFVCITGIEGGVVLWRGWCGTLKRVTWYFEEGGVVLWRGWSGYIKFNNLLSLSNFHIQIFDILEI